MVRSAFAVPASLVALVVTTVGVVPTAASDARVEVVEYGVFSTGPAQRIPQPESVSGEMNLVTGVRLIRTAEILAAQPGRSFGWRYRLHGVPAGAAITLRTLHPPLTNPSTGKTMRHSQRTIRVQNPTVARYTGYTFDYGWEMAEGIWRFQVIHAGRVIGERRFKIVVPLN